MLERVNKHLRARQQENEDAAAAIRTRLNRLHSDMMDLRDALNDAINNTARAEEVNDANERNLEDHQVSSDTKDTRDLYFIWFSAFSVSRVFTKFSVVVMMWIWID